VTWPCFYGIDIPRRDELIAAHSTITELELFLGVDSLAYLTLDNLIAAIGAPGAGFCSACLTGNYPTPVPVVLSATPAAAPRQAAPAPA
jgi:amidophosphoribosyltransferase